MSNCKCKKCGRKAQMKGYGFAYCPACYKKIYGVDFDD